MVNTNNFSYSLYGSGYTWYSIFSSLNNGSFLPIWETSPFRIEINQCHSNICLRYISIIFRRPMDNNEYLIFRGIVFPALGDSRDGGMGLKSHCQLYSRTKQ